MGMGSSGCRPRCPDKIDEYGNKDPDHYAKFHAALHESGTGGYKVEAREAEWANLRSSENEGFLQDVRTFT